MDIPAKYVIRERSHRLLNPISEAQLATLGDALHLTPGTRLLDLACGKGEMLSTWAGRHGIIGTGVDLSSAFLEAARVRAAELGVVERVQFVHDDASGHVSDQPVDVAACLGATWIGGGVTGTIALLERSLRPGGMLLVGEPYWREQPSADVVRACLGGIEVDTDAADPDAGEIEDEYLLLPDLVEKFHALGWDLVEMMLADEGSWDRYVAAGWLNMRRWLDENPDDDLAPLIRAELTSSQRIHTRYQREYLGWGVFALLRR